MEYIIIAISVAVVVVVGIVMYFKNKPKERTQEISSTLNTDAPPKGAVLRNDSSDKLKIQMEMISAETILDGTRLVEITDSKVLAHINNLVPGFAQIGNAANAANNVAQAAKVNGNVLYRAIIPSGAKLTDSKAMEGAVRGFYRGADGIQGHANLVAVEVQNGAAVVANTISAAMGVASMVVGQYYMTQINAELEVISDGISQIQDFQDNEFRSRVFSLVAHVKKISDFQTEILENEELRLFKISQLNSLEEECTQLLGQTNLTLGGIAKKTDLDYAKYTTMSGAFESEE